MAITKKPTKPVQDTAAAAAEAFISGAPDAASTTPQAPRRVRKGRKVQISLTIAEPLLDRVDELAREIGQSRAAVINMAIFHALEHGLFGK